jgi:hypothetical protein
MRAAAPESFSTTPAAPTPEQPAPVPERPRPGSLIVRAKASSADDAEVNAPSFAPLADRAALVSAAISLQQSLSVVDSDVEGARVRHCTERAVARLLRFLLDRTAQAGPCCGDDVTAADAAAAGAFAQAAARTALREASAIVNETANCLARLKAERAQMLEVLCDASKALPALVATADSDTLTSDSQELDAAATAVEAQVIAYAKHIAAAANALIGGEHAISGLVSATSRGCSVAGSAAAAEAAGALETALLSLLARLGAALSLALSLVNEADSTISVVAEVSSSFTALGQRARELAPESERARVPLAHGALRARAAGFQAWLERAIRAWRSWSAQIGVLGDVILAAVRADVENALAAVSQVPPSTSGETLRKRLATAVVVAKKLKAEAASARNRRGQLVEHIAASASRVYYSSDDQRQSVCTASAKAALRAGSDASDANAFVCECSVCVRARTKILDSVHVDIEYSTMTPTVDDELRVHVPIPATLEVSPEAQTLLGSIPVLPFRIIERVPDGLRDAASALALQLHFSELNRRELLAPDSLAALARISGHGAAATGSPQPLPESAVRIVLAAAAYIAPLGVMPPASVGTLAVFGVNTGVALTPHAMAPLGDLTPDALHNVTMSCADIETEIALEGAAANTDDDAAETGDACIVASCETERKGLRVAQHEGVHWFDVVNALDAAQLEQLALAEATTLVPLGEALVLFDEVKRLGVLNTALIERMGERSKARSALLRARTANGVSNEDTVLARVKAVVENQRDALRAAVPVFEEALERHSHTRSGALETVERLLGSAPVGAAAFSAPALAMLHAFVSGLCAAERAAADLAAALVKEVRFALEDSAF